MTIRNETRRGRRRDGWFIDCASSNGNCVCRNMVGPTRRHRSKRYTSEISRNCYHRLIRKIYNESEFIVFDWRYMIVWLDVGKKEKREGERKKLILARNHDRTIGSTEKSSLSLFSTVSYHSDEIDEENRDLSCSYASLEAYRSRGQVSVWFNDNDNRGKLRGEKELTIGSSS